MNTATRRRGDLDNGRSRIGARLHLTVAPFLLLAAAGGCSFGDLDRVRTHASDISETMPTLRKGGAEPRLTTVRVSDRPYLGVKPLADEDAARLPGEWRRADAVTVPVAGADDDATLAARIEAATGIAIRFAGSAAAGPTAIRDIFAAGDRLRPAQGVWTGSLDRLLDAWAAAAGYEWRYDGASERIDITRSGSAVFRIHALAGEQEYRVSSSTQGREGKAGSDNLTHQSITSSMTYDPWPEIREQLKAFAGPGTTVSVAPSSASVMVSGSARDLGRVRRYLGYLNREVLRPVTLSVHVYAVRLDRNSDYGLGLRFSIPRLFGTSAALEVADSAIAIVRPEAAGSDDTLAATVRALQKAGTVSRVLSADVPSLNGKPAQFFELVNQAYLKEHRTTISDGHAQTQLVPGTVSSGFAMSYLPRVTGPDEVLVRLFASLRDRPAFATFTSDRQTIQLPAFGSRAIQVTQKIGRGETLVVTGFSDRSAASDQGGTFDPAVPFPEGHRRAATARTEQLLLITAEVGAPLGVTEARGAKF